jgi:predicted nucleic acid-binding protein
VILSLDAEAVNAMAGRDGPTKRKVQRALEAAARTRSEVIVPAVVLAELYRGSARSQAVDAFLARHEAAITTRDTDRTLARYVGTILLGAGMGSEHMVDAHVVAAVVEAGGGVALTGDPDDLARLAARYQTVLVEPLG